METNEKLLDIEIHTKKSWHEPSQATTRNTEIPT